MSKTLTQRLFSSLIDTLHYWSGTFLKEAPPAPSKGAAPKEADTNLSPLHNGVQFAKQIVASVTIFLDPHLLEEVTKLSQAMRTSEPDVLLRLIKLAKLINDFGLYGVPTPDGNYLGIYVRKTGEIHRVNMECPAQVDHHPPSPAPTPRKPPSILN